MKKYSILFLLVVLISSCEKENIVTETREIYLNNCGIIINDGEQITVCFDELADSRCPLDANCAWQGVAIAKFTVYQNNISHPVSLSTLPRYNQHSSDTVIAGFKIHLENILPYPTASSPAPAASIHAVLKISK